MAHNVDVQYEQTISAVVTRCRCGQPQAHQGERCPQGEQVDLGVISYSHTDPLKNIKGKLEVARNNIRNRKARKGEIDNG
jgi:hypothetical protein